MVNVSHESAEETERRLERVITQARLKVFPSTWAFEEFPLDAFPASVRRDALALVRDDAVWSQLVPSEDPGRELFGIFRFHFAAGADNSGFVGWLATRLKRSLGTGVFVACGQNSVDGGIFDYWGVPAAVADQAFREIRAWVEGRAVTRMSGS